jgi:AcrR family transcriptional regulator
MTKRAAITTPKPYHHGALRVAMLQAAERILERDGIQGLTLRAAAREAGASHAAPKNHFGDLSGLLSDLAAVGFSRFARRLREAAAAAEATPSASRAAPGRAYVEFAIANPGLFQLMFRSERLDVSRPALRDALEEAGDVLSRTAGGADEPLARAAQMAAAWSLVHGFAMLLLDGRLGSILRQLPPGTGAMVLLDEILRRGAPGR